MAYDTRKTLAKYLIALGIVGLFRTYYGMGLIAKVIFSIFESSRNGFAITLFLSNLIMYLCFFAVIAFFYKKITTSGDRGVIALYYMWAAIFVLLPAASTLGLNAITRSATQAQIMTVEFNNATIWSTHMLIIAIHILGMALTGCILRQLRYMAAAIVLGILYFIGWRNSLQALATDVALYNNIRLGAVILTGLLLVIPPRRTEGSSCMQTDTSA